MVLGYKIRLGWDQAIIRLDLVIWLAIDMV
jgi:hypothetical protein